MLCPRSFRFKSLKWVMEADSADGRKPGAVERHGEMRAMAAFSLWREGGICYDHSVCMDDEKPLKRGDLRKRAEEKAAELAAEGAELHPVTASGRNLARKFWGKEWMKSLGACEVYGMRLAPGRTYLRYGCVLDLKTVPGRMDALVMGEHLYEVRVEAPPPDEEALARLRERCSGHVGSWIDLLKGNVSPELMEILCDPEGGLFPRPEEWRFSCSCPDWADLCKHAAAVLYAFGVMLDEQPELLFTLRGMEASALIPSAPDFSPGGEDALGGDAGSLSDIFGIRLD